MKKITAMILIMTLMIGCGGLTQPQKQLLDQSLRGSVRISRDTKEKETRVISTDVAKNLATLQAIVGKPVEDRGKDYPKYNPKYSPSQSENSREEAIKEDAEAGSGALTILGRLLGFVPGYEWVKYLWEGGLIVLFWWRERKTRKLVTANMQGVDELAKHDMLQDKTDSDGKVILAWKEVMKNEQVKLGVAKFAKQVLSWLRRRFK